MHTINCLFRDFKLVLITLGFFACFAGTAHAGINQWTSIGLADQSISALAIDPLNPATLYVATDSGIFKSTNSGSSWQTANTGLTSISVNGIAINPVDTMTLYTGYQNAIFKSTNGGSSWQDITTTGLPSMPGGLSPISIDPRNPTTLYVGTDFGGIFKSTDGGASWQTLNWNGKPSPISLWVRVITIDPINPTTLYATTFGDIFKSTDGGIHWQTINTTLTGHSASAFVINPITPTTLYAGTWLGEVFKSTDGGSQWQAIKTGIDAATIIRALAINPMFPSTVYISTFPGGIYKSTDSGEHWLAANTGLTNTNVNTLAIDPVNPATVYAGTSSGLFKITFSTTPEPSANVVLFLHGMNSNAGTWNDVVTQYFPNANCPSIYNGKINSTAKPNAQQTYCYRVKFGVFDADSPNKGLEDAWDYGEINGYDSAGDYSTFDQLGTEVNNAITAIREKLPYAKILLIAHSRGGLAAREFLQRTVLSENKNSVVGLITTGTPHEGTRLGRIYSYIKAALLNADGRVTDTDALNDWQAIDFLSGKADCNAVLGNLGFKIDARRPVISYLRDHSPMINSLNNNKANLPSAIQYGELVYDGVRLGQLDEKLNGNFAYNLFDEPNYADICHQVSRTAEAVIKGGTVAAPIASTKYPGDGIVTASSQGAIVFPKAERVTYKSSVLHTKEPQQTAHIADMTCKLGFSLLNTCPTTAQSSTTKQAKAPFKPVAIISHDYDALVALKTEQLWQDWLAVITDDTQANQREQFAIALGIKLRDSDNAAFYVDIQQRLLNTNAPQLEQARLAKLLAEIATPSALEILTDALLNPDFSAIQTALSNAILTVADALPEQPRRADLSAVLETAWTLPKQNQQQLNTLTLALAKLGTPRGVEVLLAAIDKTGAIVPSAKKKPLNTAQQQAIAAFRAMNEIINPDSETVLSRAFMSHRATEAVFIAAGNGLVNLGSDDAAQRVLQRLNELPDNAVPIGQQWLSHLSGKIDKTALRSMNKAAGMPRQQLLRQQMEEMVQ